MSERWKPGCGDSYWAVSALGKVWFVDWRSEDFDYASFEFGNYFETAEEAEAAAEKVKELLLSLHEPATELTAEVFDRPDCPEWAQYAAMDSNGAGYYYSEKPFIMSDSFGWCIVCSETNQSELIRGVFNNSNWQNSLIERPAKLPDWCKVGEWVE